jgi:hypothetical protein
MWFLDGFQVSVLVIRSFGCYDCAVCTTHMSLNMDFNH